MQSGSEYVQKYNQQYIENNNKMKAVLQNKTLNIE